MQEKRSELGAEWRRSTRKAGLALALATGSLLALAPGAMASQLTLDTSKKLTYTDAPGAETRLRIDMDCQSYGGPGGQCDSAVYELIEEDGFSGDTPTRQLPDPDGAGPCVNPKNYANEPQLYKVECPMNAFTKVEVHMGDRDDTVVTPVTRERLNGSFPAVIPADVDLGPGKDYLETGIGPDRILGGDGDDDIYSSKGYYQVKDAVEAGDLVNAGGGDDDVYGGAGADDFDLGPGGSGTQYAYGRAGDDVIQGDDSRDSISGEEGDDVLVTYAADDYAYGGPGSDQISTGAGSDSASGEAGDDLIECGDGHDGCRGDEGDDEIRGGGGVDRVDGGDGDDVLDGGEGDDNNTGTPSGYVWGGDGADKVTGGPGDDNVSGGDGYGDESLDTPSSDDVSGGDGVDKTSYSSADFRVRISLDGVANDGVLNSVGAPAEQDNIRGDIEWVNGSGYDDELTGNDSVQRFDGYSGKDRIFGRGGDDILYGDSGNDLVEGEGGADTLYGGDNDDDLKGGDGDDLLEGNAKGDVLTGGGGVDTFYGDTANNAGDTGNDTINAQDGISEPLSCGQGSDTAFADHNDLVPRVPALDACETVNQSAPPADVNQGGNNTGPGNAGAGTTGAGTTPTVKPGTTTSTTAAPDTVAPTVVVAAKSTIVAAGGKTVPFALGPATEDGTGSVALKTAGKVKAASVAAAKKKAVLTLGSSSFQMVKGQPLTVNVTLSGKARKTLKKLKRLKVQATITMRDAAGNATTKTHTFTLKAGKK